MNLFNVKKKKEAKRTSFFLKVDKLKKKEQRKKLSIIFLH